MTPTRWFCLTHKDTVRVGSQMSEGCDVYELRPVDGSLADDPAAVIVRGPYCTTHHALYSEGSPVCHLYHSQALGTTECTPLSAVIVATETGEQ